MLPNVYMSFINKLLSFNMFKLVLDVKAYIYIMKPLFSMKL